MQQAVSVLFYFLIIIPSAIIHEYAHGAMADYLGDPTARYAGRLTLNPKAHIDLWGTILMPLFLLIISGGNFVFAYAKPVPYNPYNLKNQKWGPALVSVAGPLANFFLAACFGLLMRLLPAMGQFDYLGPFFYAIIYTNVVLMVFNLLPVPPLDGSKILYAFVSDATMRRLETFFQRWGLFLLFFFVFFLFDLLTPVINLTVNLLIGPAKI